MPYMSTEEWIAWVEEQEAKGKEPPARRPAARTLPTPAPRTKGVVVSSPHEYAKGGRLPLGYKRVYQPPAEGGRSVAAGIEVDRARAAVARELFVQAARGRSIREIERILERRYGSFGVGRMAIWRTLHHELFRNPPPGLEIVDLEIVLEARSRLLARKRRRPRGRAIPGLDLSDSPDGR
jgi:hypothetical protein